jgi:hypothetical protein
LRSLSGAASAFGRQRGTIKSADVRRVKAFSWRFACESAKLKPLLLRHEKLSGIIACAVAFEEYCLA